MKLLGLLIIANALVITGWQVSTAAGNKWLITVCLIAVFVGLALTFQDRITELTIQGVGSLKAANAEASSKLEAIERIRERVEGQSATIDLIARDAKDARRLTEEIKTKSDEVEKKVKAVDAEVERASASTKELNSSLEFVNTVLAAQGDDRRAFDKLKIWADDPSFKYAKEAGQAYVKVMDDHSQGMYMSGFTVPWNEGFDPSKLDLEGLNTQYAGAPDHLKPALIEYVWNRADLKKTEKLGWLVRIMQTDPSLKAVEYAGRYFTSGTDLKIKPVAVDYLTKWWVEHKSEVKD